MPTATEKAFGIYELTERILLQLDNYLEIIRAQRVSRVWRDIIQNSPSLREACWYPPVHAQPALEDQAWRLNPAFNRLGISVGTDTQKYEGLTGEPQEEGKFSLEDYFNDQPGFWTTMVATQPPCQQLLVMCHDDYSMDGDM